MSARKVYYESVKPFLPVESAAPLSAQQQLDDALDLEDVTGKRLIETRLMRAVTIREENAVAALETMSRFAVNPKWLIYLPPTMSPTDTSHEAGLLEHPAEAFRYYLNEGIGRVVCEEKHMGSRAVVIVCRESEVVRRRFGITEDESGIIITRTGRRFFNHRDLESEMLARVRTAFEESNLWDELATDWAILDCELMPWSAKAQELLRGQYAAVGASAHIAFTEANNALTTIAARLATDDAANALRQRFEQRGETIQNYIEAYRRYCWSVESVDDYRLAPFHVLATEGTTHVDKNHDWHLNTIARLCATSDRVLFTTQHLTVETTDAESCARGVEWWREITTRGGEGMVVKPFDFIARGARGIAQPAIKCRGREYLRIIYGAEYTIEENLARLRARGLGRKRSLALREFALGIEALERFVRREPLRRVHECVFGVLALESEPVDPRL